MIPDDLDERLGQLSPTPPLADDSMGFAPLCAELRLFGSIALTSIATGADATLSSRRVRGLVAYVALQRSCVAQRSRLAGLFWSDRAETQARASLRQALTELKAALIGFDPAPFDIARETVSLRADVVRVDVRHLEAALERRDHTALTAILARIGSDILCDEPAVSPLHQEWIDQIRGHFDQRLAAGVHDLLADLVSTDPSAARALASPFLRRQPFDEEVTAAAMRAEVAMGAAAAAILRFAAFRTALERDLQVKPGFAVQAALRIALSATVAAEESPAKRAATPLEAAEAAPTPPAVVVAVFSAEASAARWASAVREDVLSGLSRFRELSLVAETREAGDVPRGLWAGRADAYLLTGAGQARSGAIRLVVQLIRMEDGIVLWSDQADLEESASGAIVDRLVARVVGAILPAIQSDLAPRLPAAPPSVYGRYLLARDRAAHAIDWEDARAAAGELEALVVEAPRFSLPYLPLARLYNTDFSFTRAGASGPAERQRAFHLAKAALALDRSHVHGYTVMGWCYLWRRSWEAARRHFDQAVELNPFNADRLMEVGFGNLFLGDLARARELLERCLVLNPAPKDGFFMDLGLLELIEGRHELAQAHFDMIAQPTVFDELYMAANGVISGTPDLDRAGSAARRVAAIWPLNAPSTAEAMSDWFATAHPFRSDPVAQKLKLAVREALERAM